MPSFGSEFDEIVRTLLGDGAEGPQGPGAGPEPGPTFRGLLAAFFGTLKAGQPDRLLDAIDRLGLSDDPEALAEAEPAVLLDGLRDPRGKVPPGLVPTLRRLASWVAGHGGMDSLAGLDAESLRDELRAIRGVGPSTVDRLLLEGVGKPAYPMSRSDYRILVRHSWIDPTADYDEARSVVEDAAGGDPALLLRLSEGFGALATHCRVAAPRCDRCPLRPMLPEGGPVEP